MIHLRRIAFISLIGCLFFYAGTGFAQGDAAKWLQFHEISARGDKQPDNITHIIQDKKGFLWISTLNGLFRYDGSEFKTYRHDPRQKDSLFDNLISSMVVAGENRLLLGTIQGGAFLFDTNTEKAQAIFPSNDNLKSIQVQSLLLEKNASILWIGSYLGLYRLELNTGNIEQFSHNPLDPYTLPGRLVTSILRDRANQLWIGTDSGLARFNEQTQEFNQYALEDENVAPVRITRLYMDNDGSLWVGSETGLFHIKSAGSVVEKVTLSSKSPIVTDIKRMHSGDLWITTNQGLVVINAYGGDKSYYSFASEDPLSLMENDISTLFEDYSHLVFLGATKGIFQSAPGLSNFGRILHSPFSEDSLSHNFVTGFAESVKGKTLISTLNGLDQFELSSNRISHLKSRAQRLKNNPKIHAIEEDNQSRYWVGNATGNIDVFNSKWRHLKQFQINRNNPNAINPVNFIKPLKNGTIWIGSNQNLLEIDSISLKIIKKYHVGGDHILENFQISDVVEDQKGNIWFGTLDAGIIKQVAENKQFIQYKHLDNELNSLSNNHINQLFVDLQNNLWIATANGLNQLPDIEQQNNDPSFKKWFESDGINDADIRSFILDNRGWLWLATSTGISRLNLKNNHFQNFSISDGVPAQNFNSGVALMNQQGLLFFGSNHGVTLINPQNFKNNLFSTGVLIDRVRIKQQPWTNLSFLENPLEYNQNDIDIKVSYPSYYQPEKTHFYYRLNHSNKQVQDNKNNDIIKLRNLANGTYHLEIFAKNGDQVQSSQSALVSFTIAPPPWFSIWAIMGYVFVFIAISYLFLRNQRRQIQHEREIAFHLRKNDKLKDEFLAVISHELRTPLTGIIGLSESLIEGSGGRQNPKTIKTLNLILNSSHRLADLVNEILDYKKLSHNSLTIEVRTIDLSALIEVVVTNCKPLIKDKPLTIKVELDPDLPLVAADPKRLQQILYNLIGNAIKFTEKGRVIVSSRQDGDRVRIDIKDTGIGIAKENLDIIFNPFKQIEPSKTRQFTGSGLGLSITRQLVELHRSSLSVNSVPGRGSCFSFTLEKGSKDHLQENITPVFFESKDLDDIKDNSLPDSSNNKSFSSEVSIPVTGENKETILVADDEAINRKVICDFLNLAGYQTIQAQNGDEALKIAQTQSIDLLILDVMMPKLSGFEVSKQLRRQFSSIQLPILLISARRDSRDIVTGLESGANDYISKPVDKNVLIARTQTLLLLKRISVQEQSLQSKKTLTNVINQLSRYFPKVLVEKLVNQKQVSKIEASRKLVTVIFADLVRFTELTDRFEAEVITDLVNQFVSEMSSLVDTHHGLLNEVLGDGLVILFGAPEAMSKRDQAVEAINLAIEMQQKMDYLGKKWLDQGLDHNVQLRIGIHQDFATVGNIGSDNLLAYRAIGSGINLASRLQNECEPGKLLISYPVYAQTREMFDFEPLQEILFKGFTHSHRVCQIDPEKNP